MIISASYRTDIPAWYATWFERRLAAGWCTAEPDNRRRVQLVPPASPGACAVSGYVFWTRNVAPFMAPLVKLASLGVPWYVSHTITGYPTTLEPHVPTVADAVAAVKQVDTSFGSDRVVWRYDPVILGGNLDEAWHRRNFTTIADALGGRIDEVVVSFLTPYSWSLAGLRKAGLEPERPDLATQQRLLADLAYIARDRGMTLRTCAQPRSDMPPARCIDTGRLSRLAGHEVSSPTAPRRSGCGCAKALDIGDYGTCRAGCVYCYARRDADVPGHDPSATGLRGTPLRRTLPLFGDEE